MVICLYKYLIMVKLVSGGLVSAFQVRNHGFELYLVHDHVSLYDISFGWFQDADSKVIKITCKNLFHNRP
jgi:hypothetical protein